MSRIGRMPVAIPANVTVTIADGNVVTVKGPLGTLTETFSTLLTIKQEGAELIVTRPNDEKETRSLHGLTRALLNNMVIGVTTGYSKTLEVVGVGYKVAKQGKNLQLYLGHSLVKGLPQEKLVVAEPDGITFEVPNPNTIVVKGINKQAVGQIAAVIRGKRPPNPTMARVSSTPTSTFAARPVKPVNNERSGLIWLREKTAIWLALKDIRESELRSPAPQSAPVSLYIAPMRTSALRSSTTSLASRWFPLPPLKRRLKESAATRQPLASLVRPSQSAQLQKVSPRSYSTVAAIFTTDVYRNWLKALARAA